MVDMHRFTQLVLTMPMLKPESLQRWTVKSNAMETVKKSAIRSFYPTPRS